MKQYKRYITKEQYERALKNGGYITTNDEKLIFNICELCGYGVYSPMVAKEGDKYIVNFYIGDSCD